MSNRKKMIVGAALAALFPATEAMSMPLMNLRVLGRNVTDGQVGFSSTIVAGAGDVIEYQVLTGLQPIGSTNGTRTITSKTDGTDGVQNLKFNIYDPTTDAGDLGAFSSLTLNAGGGWASVIGAQGGVPDGNSAGENSLDNVRPGQAAGVYAAGTANGEVVVGTGQVTFLSTEADLGAIRLGVNQPQNINTSAAGTFRYNGATIVAPTTTTEASADPFMGLIPLQINVPEPASMGLIALAGLALGRRRRSN